MKKLVVFYSIFVMVESAYGVLTYFYWDDDEEIDFESEFGLRWKLNFARVIPVTIITTFGLFNIWI